MSNSAVAVRKNSLSRLNKSLAKGSLNDLVRDRMRAKSMLLVDVSGSMGDTIASGARKIDALRDVVATLRETHPVPIAAFGLNAKPAVAFVEKIPDPSGMTPLAEGIDFSKQARATHIIVVTDGQPDDQDEALEAARRFGGVVDVFFIGDENGHGAAFCRELASVSGGAVNITDLSDPKRLAAKIAGFLPAAQ